jgi:hypothetical protein
VSALSIGVSRTAEALSRLQELGVAWPYLVQNGDLCDCVRFHRIPGDEVVMPQHPVVAQRFAVDAVLSVRVETTLACGTLRSVVEFLRRTAERWETSDVDDARQAARGADPATAKHQGAVDAERRDRQVTAVVSENGRGLQFEGRYDLDHLISARRAAATLEQPVAELEGTSVVESSRPGTQIVSLDTGTSGA